MGTDSQAHGTLVFYRFHRQWFKEFAEFQSELYKSEAREKFQESKYRKLQQQPLSASHVIAISMKRSAEGKVPEIEEIAAVACAVQNIYLSVSAYGLGGYWTTGGITYFDRAKAFFELQEQDKLLGFFYIGYVATPSVLSKRTPLAEKVKWVEG